MIENFIQEEKFTSLLIRSSLLYAFILYVKLKIEKLDTLFTTCKTFLFILLNFLNFMH